MPSEPTAGIERNAAERERQGNYFPDKLLAAELISGEMEPCNGM
jgi:hypothetical protein